MLVTWKLNFFCLDSKHDAVTQAFESMVDWIGISMTPKILIKSIHAIASEWEMHILCTSQSREIRTSYAHCLWIGMNEMEIVDAVASYLDFGIVLLLRIINIK